METRHRAVKPSVDQLEPERLLLVLSNSAIGESPHDART